MCKLKLRVKCLNYQSLRNRCLINMEVSHVNQNLILPKHNSQSKSDRPWIMSNDRNANYKHTVKITALAYFNLDAHQISKFTKANSAHFRR